MGFILALANEDTVIDFISDDYHLMDGGFKLNPPKKEQVWGNASKLGLGRKLIDYYYENRDAEILFRLHSSSRARLISMVNDIERILNQAREHSMGTSGSRVELRYQWDGSASPTYFEVIDGEFSYPDDIMSVEQIVQFDGTYYSIHDCKLTLIMNPFSYGFAPTSGQMVEVPLTNGNGTGVLGGIDVYSVDDNVAGRDNYVEILGSDVIGDALAITKISIEGVSTGSIPAKVSIGHHKKKTIAHIYEDETMAFADNFVAVVDAAASHGTYRMFAFTPETESKFGSWLVQNPEDYGAEAYRATLVARLGFPFDPGMNYRLKITPTSTDTVFFETDWISPLSATSYLDLGVIVLPPFSPNLDNVADLHISLWGQRKTPGESEFSIDYLYLLPIAEGYRVLVNKVPPANGSFGDTLVDDNWNDVLYVTDGTHNLGTLDGLFSPIRLIPGEDQRLYFLFNDLYDFQPPTFYYKVRVWMTPVTTTLV